MQDTVLLYKQLGQTPLELINDFKRINSDYADVKMAYAGRLDPMAHGLMLYLVADECKKRDKYQDMKKAYEFDLVIGIETDTHDALGIIKNTSFVGIQDVEAKLEKMLEILPGEFEQEYPAFSSKTIDGVPMYQLAKENKLEGLKIPSKKVTVTSAKILDVTQINSDTFLNLIKERINKVKGDFRQQEIIKLWNKLFSNNKIELPVFRIRIEAGSGTYMRSLADQIGKQLGTFALAFDILRTDIDSYKLKNAKNYQDYLQSYSGIFSDHSV